MPYGEGEYMEELMAASDAGVAFMELFRSTSCRGGAGRQQQPRRNWWV